VKRVALIAAILLLVSARGMNAAGKDNQKAKGSGHPTPIALLDGGRRLDFIRIVSTEQDLHLSRSLFSKFVDLVAGAPEWHKMVRPYAVATDSRGRLIVTDPGIPAVHILDFEKKKYTLIEGGNKQPFLSPIGVAVDGEDNIYISDSQLGQVLVFEPNGKFRKTIGLIRGGEGFYKRPTGLAIDAAAKRLYIADTLRNRIYITDFDGNVVKYIGERGSANGQFNFPTELRISEDKLYVVDAMNFRVQIFDREGKFLSTFGQIGDSEGSIFRPKGISVDSEGNVYLVDSLAEGVKVFNKEGKLLFRFGESGPRPTQFQLPSGIWIDSKDRVYVADSYNHRVQVFQFIGAAHATGGQR